MSFDDIDEILV